MASYNWSKVQALSAFGHDIVKITSATTGQVIWQKEVPEEEAPESTEEEVPT